MTGRRCTDPGLAALLHEVGNLIFAAEAQAEVLAAELDLPSDHPVRRHLATSRARFEALVRDVELLSAPPTEGRSTLVQVLALAASRAPAAWPVPDVDATLTGPAPELADALATLVHAAGGDRAVVSLEVFPREVRLVVDGPPGGPSGRAFVVDPFSVRAPGESRLAVARALAVLRAADGQLDAGEVAGLRLVVRLPRVVGDADS